MGCSPRIAYPWFCAQIFTNGLRGPYMVPGSNLDQLHTCQTLPHLDIFPPNVFSIFPELKNSYILLHCMTDFSLRL